MADKNRTDIFVVNMPKSICPLNSMDNFHDFFIRRRGNTETSIWQRINNTENHKLLEL